MKLRTKFVILLVGVFVAALVANVAWTDYTLRQQMEAELQERGEVIALQMQQTWNYLVESRDADGTGGAAYGPSASGYYYTVYDEDNCAVAGREISITFTDSSGYVTRYVSDRPRNTADLPDEFESQALEAFRADNAPESYASIVDYKGRQVYRYTEPMHVADICLDCHGGPAGEIDSTGFPKEGYALGDVIGEVSIVVPMDSFVENERSSAARSVAIFMVLLAVVLVVVYVGLSHFVARPVETVQQGFVRVGKGELKVRIDDNLGSRELNDLADSFNHSAEELEKAYDGLEAEISNRTAQLHEANDALEGQRRQLEEANELLRTENQYKTDFLAIVSHELRTPLTSILAFTEMLKDEGGLDAEGETARREIEANSRVLLLMINDILEMSRLDAGRMQLSIEAVDVYDLMGFVESVVAPIARRAGVDFECNAASAVPLVQGDFDKLAHALENLAFNAVKFTPEGGKVSIVASADESGDTVRISVIDTGIGIAPEDQQRVFERFVQADSSTKRRYNGTGLGLPLAKEYVELHGGTLELESAVGEGSTFTVVLPVGGPA